MPSSDILIAFFIATLIFGYMPGPALLYAAAQTIARGRRAGWFAALGLHIGGYAHVITAALGLAILFQAVPALYTALKFAGAAYLIFLGLKMFRSKEMPASASQEITAKSPRRAFWESITIEVLNPKTALFYLAFLPQFTDPGASFPIWLQLLILGTIVNVVFSSADIVCVLLADKIATALVKSQSTGRLVKRIGGGILIALGLNLVLNKG